MNYSELVEIIRFSDTGFNCKEERDEKFYNILIDNINKDYKYEEEKFNDSVSLNVKGCFAYTYRYNRQAICSQGVLAFRNGQKKNYIYMPLDEIVYVRNVKSDHNTSLITQILCSTSLGSTIIRPVDKHIFVQMKLASLLDRTDTCYRKCGYANEIITEVFLTEDQINKYKRANILKRILLHIQQLIGMIKIYKS